MGTRNLSLCKKDGQIKIAQYGQWDGYPSGQGATILKFCQDKENLQRLKNRLADIRPLEEIKGFLLEYDKLAPAWSNEIDKRTTEMKVWWNTLMHRDIGGEIFENIAHLDTSKMPAVMGDNIYIEHYWDLDKTDNYCDVWIEYAYLINFDTNKLECYGYGNLLKEYDLDNLPTVDEFIKELEGDDEE
jgi:hypothetical protein